MQQFPKWKYHKSLEAKIVQSAEEEAALGLGWVDSPAFIDQVEIAEEESDVPPEMVAGIQDEEVKPKRRGRPRKEA